MQKGKGQSHKIRCARTLVSEMWEFSAYLPRGLQKSDSANKCHIHSSDCPFREYERQGTEHDMHVTSSIWPHSSGVSASICFLNPQTAVKDSSNVVQEGGREGCGSRYKHHTLQLRCFLMALKRLSKGKPLCWRARSRSAICKYYFACLCQQRSSPSVGSSTTWFSSFVTLRTWWVKSSVGIPHWAGFPSDFIWFELYENLSECSDLL